MILIDCQVQAMRVKSCRRSVITTIRYDRRAVKMFSTDHVTQVLAARGRAQAFDVWREAATLVATRWQLFLEAEAGGRQWAFASYVAALDAEEAAAAEMSALVLPLAA
jgi:hypothetical protein